MLRGEPAVDPEIDRIARAYAEIALKRFGVLMVVIGLPVVLVVALLLGLIGALFDLPTVAVEAVFVVGAIGWFVLASRRKLALTRLLNVSRGEPRTPVTPGVYERLEIRTSTGGALRMTAPYLCMVILMLAAGLVTSILLLTGIAVVLGVPVVAYTGYLLVSALSGHPLVLDDDGIHAPRHGLRVGWESVREIRVVPLRASARDVRQVIAFLLDDDQIFLRQLPRWQAFIARMNKKTYLSPLVMMDGLVDKPIDEIAAAAAALSSLPVMRSGPTPDQR